MNAIGGRLAAQGTSLKVNADHWGDKAKSSLFSKQQKDCIPKEHYGVIELEQWWLEKHCQAEAEMNFFLQGAIYVP